MFEKSPPLKLSEIQKATKNFDESLVIGRGCFGSVYKGEVSNVLAAIKRWDRDSKQGATKSWPEVETLSSLRHRNLVSLIGYVKEVKRRPWKLVCSGTPNEEMETILVYEYIPNGTLKDHLHVHRTPLSWLQRLNICIGVARGLHYLHSFRVTHGDLRSSNILLTESWMSKISDYRLSKLGPKYNSSFSALIIPYGACGYWDPHSLLLGQLTRESDVYSFGVVMLEVLCRKPTVDESRDDSRRCLVETAQDRVLEDNRFRN